jgi:hypothetical protein
MNYVTAAVSLYMAVAGLLQCLKPKVPLIQAINVLSYFKGAQAKTYPPAHDTDFFTCCAFSENLP